MDELEQHILAVLTNAIVTERNLHPERLAPHVAAAFRAYGDERVAALAHALRQAAYVVRRDGGPEVRAKTFEDAAAFCDRALE